MYSVFNISMYCTYFCLNYFQVKHCHNIVKKYVRSKLPMFDPLPPFPLFIPIGFTCTPPPPPPSLPQCTFALVSNLPPPLSKKVPRR